MSSPLEWTFAVSREIDFPAGWVPRRDVGRNPVSRALIFSQQPIGRHFSLSFDGDFSPFFKYILFPQAPLGFLRDLDGTGRPR